MRICNADVKIISDINGKDELIKIETIARNCYKSENRISEDTAAPFVKMLINKGHEAMLEHISLSVKFVVDRAISHEIVRHRLASFAQESTRYCNYSKKDFSSEITVIKPCYLLEDTNAYRVWELSMAQAEKAYFDLLNHGLTAQEARAVLPNSLKTELIMTANLREWRHFLKLRCSHYAHPQMQEVAIKLLNELKSKIPIIFDDLSIN